MTVYLKFYGSIGLDLLVFAGEFEFDPLRDVILDHEGRLAHRSPLRIGKGPHPPRSRRDGRIERNRQRPAAGALIRQHRAAELDAIRPLDHQSQRSARNGITQAIAQQRREIDRLIGAVDTALGVDEGVRARGDRPAGNTAVGQIEGADFRLRKA